MADPAPDRVRVSGPLASVADGFRVHLGGQGYSLWSAQFQLLLVAHLSRSMDAEGLDVAQLTPSVVESFLAERRSQGYVTRLSPRGDPAAAGVSRWARCASSGRGCVLAG